VSEKFKETLLSRDGWCWTIDAFLRVYRHVRSQIHKTDIK